MGMYRISDLNIEIRTECKTLLKNAEQFTITYECKPNLSFSMSNDLIIQLMEEHEGSTAETIQTDYFAYIYSRSLFDFNGVPIRSVAVENNGSAVLFSAPYEDIDLLDYLPKDKVFAVDFPGIRLREDLNQFIAYDTPFGRNGDKAKHRMLPISSLVFVDSGRFSSLKKLVPNDFVAPFTRAVMLNIVHERTKHTLFMLEKFKNIVDIYGVNKLDDIDFILERV